MALLEKWRKMAYDENADKNKLQKLWADYFEVEKGIHNQLLADPDTAVTGTVAELAEKYGTVPLPPYLHRDATEDDIKRYQTVWAKNMGSAAAPTATAAP